MAEAKKYGIAVSYTHLTLQELEGWKWNGYRLSLGGTSHVALTAFLERHPEIKLSLIHI